MNIRPEQSSLYTKYTKASSTLTKKDLFPKNKIKESDFLKHIDFSKVNSGAGLYNELKKQHTFPLELLKSIVYEKATQSSGVKNTEI